MKNLFIFLLVCKVFSWGNEGANGVTPEINKWLNGKKVIAVQQSTVSGDGGYGGFIQTTYLTIIAEDGK